MLRRNVGQGCEHFLLHRACARGDASGVEYHLKQGATVQSGDIRGATPLHVAAGWGQVEVVNLLLASGADANAMTRTRRSPLHAAVSAGDRYVAASQTGGHRGRLRWRVMRLKGDAALADWIRQRRLATVQRLIGAGAQVNHRDDNLGTALHLAAAAGRIEVAGLLLAAGAEVDAPSRTGVTALQRAAASDEPDMTRLLLDHGADVNAGDRRNVTPLYAASHCGSRETVELLLARGAAVSAATLPAWRRIAGETPLHVAASNRRAEIVELLLKNGADPNMCNGYDATPLHNASTSAVAELLIRHGAEIDAGIARDGVTPLIMAVTNSHFDVAAALLAHGADPNVEDNCGRTPLMRAHDERMTALLIRHGARPCPSRRDGRTPLHETASSQMSSLTQLEMLLAAGADVNARDSNGVTPLHMTGIARDEALAESLARLLIKNGADPTARDAAGKTPLDKAIERGNRRMAELFRSL